jgi:hypothetical protein
MRVLRFFINIDKEEEWLNAMARKGWRLVKKSFAYTFRKVEPEEAVIRIDYRSFRRRDDYADYLALFRDCGWEHIAGTRSSGAHYFRKETHAGGDDIFSDAGSKAGRYKRMSHMWLSLACCFLPIFAALLTTDAIDASALLNPKMLYYTPGLWERSGGAFWSGFLFETPFALLRGVLWLWLPVMIVLYAMFAAKANKLYRSAELD